MNNFKNLPNQLLQLINETNESFNMLDDLMVNGSDSLVNLSPYFGTNVTGSDMDVVDSFINYVKDTGTDDGNGDIYRTISLDNGQIIQFVYHCNTELGGNPITHIYCNAVDGTPWRALIYKRYSEGVGGYVATISSNLSDINGSDVNFDDFIYKIKDSWVNNVIISSALSSLYDFIPLGITWGGNTVNQFIQTFKDKVSQYVDTSTIEISNIKTTYNYIINAARNGFLGIINAINQYYKALSTASSDENNRVKFINNNDYVSTAFFTGCLSVVTNVLSNIIAPILFLANKVLGIIAGIISIGLNIINNLIQVNVNELVYANYNNTYGLLPYDFPTNLGKAAVSTQSQEYQLVDATFRNALNQYGCIQMNNLFSSTFIWKDSDSLIDFGVNMQSRPILNHKCSIFDFPAIFEKADMVGSAYNKILVDFHEFESYDDLLDYVTPIILDDATEINYTGSSANIDSDLKARYAGSFNLLALFIMYEVCKSSGVYTYTANINTSNPIDALLFNAGWLFSPSTGSAYYENVSWDDLINDNDNTGGYIGLIHKHFESEYISAVCRCYSSRLKLSNWLNFDIISPTSSMLPSPVSLPKYEKGDVIRTLVITGAVIAISATTIAIVSYKAKRAISMSKAKLVANAESSWANFKENPTAENYNKYYKATRVNNLFSKLYGGTTYSVNGFWNDTSSDTHDKLQKLSEVLNHAGTQLPVTPDDTTGIKYIASLIKSI